MKTRRRGRRRCVYRLYASLLWCMSSERVCVCVRVMKELYLFIFHRISQTVRQSDRNHRREHALSDFLFSIFRSVHSHGTTPNYKLNFSRNEIWQKKIVKNGEWIRLANFGHFRNDLSRNSVETSHRHWNFHHFHANTVVKQIITFSFRDYFFRLRVSVSVIWPVYCITTWGAGANENDIY